MQRARPWLSWAAGLALLLSAPWMGLRLAIEVGAILARGYSPLLPRVLGSWQTALFVTLVLALVLVRKKSEHLPSFRGFKAQRRRWLVAGLLLCAGLWLRQKAVSINQVGLIADPPDKTFWIDKGHPQRQPSHVTSNQYGFRDSHWVREPPQATTRVLLVGDSFVYGAGIPDYEGLLHRQLARMLREHSPEISWEVLNGGHPGWSHLSYFGAALVLMRELHPKVIVIGSLGGSDWDVFDYQQQLELLGRPLFLAAGQLGAVRDLNELSLSYERNGCPRGQQCPRMGSAIATAALQRLISEAATFGTEIVVWEYYLPIAFFGEFPAPNFHRATWPSGYENWADDPTLAIPIDRHPTARGNLIIASSLAPVVSRLVRPPRHTEDGAP